VPSPMSDTVVATTTDSLPQNISHNPRTFSWKVRTVGDNWQELDNTTNPFWVTWGEPNFGGAGVTAQRVNWVTDKADGCDSEEEIADAIWGALADQDPPYEPGEKPSHVQEGKEWELLDEQSGKYGACYDQARLMTAALAMLGVPSQFRTACASDRDGETPYYVEDAEHRQCVLDGGKLEFLRLCFGPKAPENVNNFEGCCLVGGTWYAVWPKAKAASGLLMLHYLRDNYQVTQWWTWWDDDQQKYFFCTDETEPVPMP